MCVWRRWKLQTNVVTKTKSSRRGKRIKAAWRREREYYYYNVVIIIFTCVYNIRYVTVELQRNIIITYCCCIGHITRYRSSGHRRRRRFSTDSHRILGGKVTTTTAQIKKKKKTLAKKIVWRRRDGRSKNKKNDIVVRLYIIILIHVGRAAICRFRIKNRFSEEILRTSRTPPVRWDRLVQQYFRIIFYIVGDGFDQILSR